MVHIVAVPTYTSIRDQAVNLLRSEGVDVLELAVVEGGSNCMTFRQRLEDGVAGFLPLVNQIAPKWATVGTPNCDTNGFSILLVGDRTAAIFWGQQEPSTAGNSATVDHSEVHPEIAEVDDTHERLVQESVLILCDAMNNRATKMRDFAMAQPHDLDSLSREVRATATNKLRFLAASAEVKQDLTWHAHLRADDIAERLRKEVRLRHLHELRMKSREYAADIVNTTVEDIASYPAAALRDVAYEYLQHIDKDCANRDLAHQVAQAIKELLRERAAVD